MRTTDNNNSKTVFEIEGFTENSIKDLDQIANRSIKSLIKENQNLLLFPANLNEYSDGLDDENAWIFTLIDDQNISKLTTGNIMGFVGRNDTKLTISSRFYPKGNDYFLHYMLQKVFAINIFRFDQKKGDDNIWDFLLYLFPFYLKKALRQGLFKEYQHKEYNNSNVKGTIDISRHIGINYPFMGKVAFRTREHSYDNRITQLIRHTIEHIRNHIWGHSILNNDIDTKSAVNQIIYTTPTFERNQRQKIIAQNLKPVNHPYYTEYKMLQKICLQILRHEGITFGKEKDKIYGLLFDGAWLWEEYLNTVLKHKNYIHPRNKGKVGDKKPIYLFMENNYYKRYPDFYHDEKKTILDAKYKQLGNSTNEIKRDDMHQIISYMHIKMASLGGFIYPFEKATETCEIKFDEIGILNGYGGKINEYGIPVYHEIENFKEYCGTMKIVEEFLVSHF